MTRPGSNPNRYAQAGAKPQVESLSIEFSEDEDGSLEISMSSSGMP